MATKRSSDRDEKTFSKRHRTESDDKMPELYDIFYGEVASVQPYGVFVKIPGFRKQGLVHKSQMTRARVDDPSEMVSKGEKVYVKVISVEDEKVGLSMKVINQTTGRDEDPTNVQSSMDEQRKKKMPLGQKPRIELGAVLDTTCKKCGGHGHLAQDCFHTVGGKTYDLIPDVEEKSFFKKETEADIEKSSPKKKKKKEKKAKKSKKSKKHKYVSSSSSDSDDRHHSKHKKHKHHKKRKHRSSSSDS